VGSLDPKIEQSTVVTAPQKQRKTRRHFWLNQQQTAAQTSAEIQAQEAENERLENEREQRLAVKSLFGRELNEAHIPLVSIETISGQFF